MDNKVFLRKFATMSDNLRAFPAFTKKIIYKKIPGLSKKYIDRSLTELRKEWLVKYVYVPSKY